MMKTGEILMIVSTSSRVRPDAPSKCSFGVFKDINCNINFVLAVRRDAPYKNSIKETK